jgi:hypothetical protein
LKSSALGGLTSDALKRVFGILEQPCQQSPDGVILARRSQTSGWLTYGILAESGFDPAIFSDLYSALDPRIDKRLRFDPVQGIAARAAVRRWLDAGDFGQLTHKCIERPSPDERHLWLRDIVLPAFFEKYPKGKIASVTYARPVGSHLSLLNVLQRSQVLETADPNILKTYFGRDSMAAYGLSVPAELLWMMLSFASLFSFPDSYAFVASCEHQFYLLFITDEPIRIARDEEESYSPMDRIMPIMRKAFNADREALRTVVSDDFLPPKLDYPFSRRRYDASTISAFLSVYVEKLDVFLHWLSEACNFVDNAGQYDLTFALQTYLTVHVLLNTTFRFIVEQQDMFARKMQFFDVLELYAGLVDCARGQTAAWHFHLTEQFHCKLLDQLRLYPAPFDEDWVAAATSIFENNDHIIGRGLLYGRESDGTIKVPRVSAGMSLDEFRPQLLRALRNTKHGLSINSANFLEVHTGETSNDLPDYAIGLWLNLVSDQSLYTLAH